MQLGVMFTDIANHKDGQELQYCSFENGLMSLCAWYRSKQALPPTAALGSCAPLAIVCAALPCCYLACRSVSMSHGMSCRHPLHPCQMLSSNPCLSNHRLSCLFTCFTGCLVALLGAIVM